jgi:hypothetical protein
MQKLVSRGFAAEVRARVRGPQAPLAMTTTGAAR